ncbi:MAG TPA: 50S ribosomal protein L9 [Ignavibacteria bacterium]|nr:50S ribosomal protein L9 [Ignavibacteria bacterium]
MKVILKQDYDTLGNAGDIKDVKDGYARNFLIPKGIVMAATPSNIRSFEEMRRQQGRKIDRETQAAKQLAFNLEKDTLVIYAKAGEEDKLFGSITSQMIYDALVEKGFENIDKKKISIPEHIKTLGAHTVNIKLYTDVTANLKLEVKDEKDLNAEDTPQVDTEAAEEN